MGSNPIDLLWGGGHMPPPLCKTSVKLAKKLGRIPKGVWLLTRKITSISDAKNISFSKLQSNISPMRAAASSKDFHNSNHRV